MRYNSDYNIDSSSFLSFRIGLMGLTLSILKSLSLHSNSFTLGRLSSTVGSGRLYMTFPARNICTSHQDHESPAQFHAYGPGVKDLAKCPNFPYSNNTPKPLSFWLLVPYTYGGTSHGHKALISICSLRMNQMRSFVS
jgi:hypothetical protein